MNSASIAKLRLQKDSIEQKKLAELKEIAAELGLSNADVKHYGTLTLKATWLVAVNTKIAELFEDSATVQHGEGDRIIEPEGDSTDTTITQTDMIVTEEILPFFDPEDNENEDEEDDEDEDEEDDEATMKTVSPICADIILAFPTFNYYQLIAFHYGVLLAHQDYQPVACALDSLGYSDRYSSEELLTLKLSEFIPDQYDRDQLIRTVDILLKKSTILKKPENCCLGCDGLGNIFAGIADHLIDWETCPHCHGKGFLEPVPTPDTCPDCDGTGEILDFSGEDSEPCPTCSTPEPKTEPKLSQPSVNVSVLVKFADSNFEHSRSVAAIAKSFDGACWCSGYLPDGYEEHWSFSSFSFASNFKEQCQAMPFVLSATIDRVASNTPITPPTDTSLYASDLEKETVIAFFRSEGSTPEELEEVRRQPLAKAEAAIVLGYAEYCSKSAEISLQVYLIDWVNDDKIQAQIATSIMCANRTEPTETINSAWSLRECLAKAKEKLAAQFKLRPGETDCFISPDGSRTSFPSSEKESILSPEESEYISPNDPVIQMMGCGYLSALEQFKEKVSLSLSVN